MIETMEFEGKDIDWKMNREEILQTLCKIYSVELEGSPIRVERNSTKGEMNLDLFRIGVTNRVGQIWPKKRDRRIELVLAKDIVDQVKADVDFPTDYNIAKGDKERGYYKEIDYPMSVSIMKSIKKRCK